jgi:LppP/LprE lipoprotein
VPHLLPLHGRKGSAGLREPVKRDDRPRRTFGNVDDGGIGVAGVIRLRLPVLLVGLVVLSTPAASAAKAPDLHRAEAFVDKQCPADEREISTQMWVPEFGLNVLYGNCRAGDGRDQHVWFFAHSRFVGSDAPNSSHDIVGIWRDDKTIAFMYVLYRQSDPECCPTGGGAMVRFRWNGTRITRLDPLPRRAFTPGVQAGR